MIPTLTSEYWRLRRELPSVTQRNMPFYLLIRDRYSDFRWRETPHGTIIDFQLEGRKGVKPSLLSLLAGIVPDSPPPPIRRRAALDRLPARVAGDLLSMMSEAGFVEPSDEQLSLIVEWLLRGLSGEPLTIVSPVCPDYEVESGDGARHRFTFGGLGGGPGVTARRLFEALPAIHCHLIAKHRLAASHHVCPGDFEAFSAETNARLGIGEADFLERLEGSRRAILAQAPTPITACFFTDLCGGKTGWQQLYDDTLARMQAGDFGPVAGTPWLLDIARARRGLYDRWYDVRNQPDAFYEAIALRQGAEYAAMGLAVSRSPQCPNPLVLGADDHKIGDFYQLATSIPVLYLKRNYE